MTPSRCTSFMLVALFVSGCGDGQSGPLPAPHRLTAAAIGHYCGMNVLEHGGPKGQIILSNALPPVWFSSARDALAYTMLDEETKAISAIYVSDMGRAQSWDNPGQENWVEARSAFFVIGSRKNGGMGAPEAVPFAKRDDAQRFARENGGSIVTFAEVPRSYVLGSEQMPSL